MRVSVDIAVFMMREVMPALLLVQRANDPFKDAWALPGGFVELEEDLPDAASRELEEETKLLVPPHLLRQFRTYGEPGRAPERTITVVFRAFIRDPEDPIASDDAKDAEFVPILEIPQRALAFDHDRIMRDLIRQALPKTSLAS